MAWLFGGIALLGFVLLMVFAINNSNENGDGTTTTTTVPDNEVAPEGDDDGG